MSKYDIAVAYRIYPMVSKIPALFPDSKIKLAEFCIKSFKDSLGPITAKIWVILDGCPNEFKHLFNKYFDFDQLVFIETNSIGNLATFDLQIKILLNQADSEYVFFAEDDYYYKPNEFPKLLSLLKENTHIDFVTPYDHPDYYKLQFHGYRSRIQPSSDHYWHEVSSTCLTFLTKKSVLSETQNVLHSYAKGDLDSSMWLSLTKLNFCSASNLLWSFFSFDIMTIAAVYRVLKFNCRQLIFGKKRVLMAPIPSIAAHLDRDHLPPGSNWQVKLNSLIDS